MASQAEIDELRRKAALAVGDNTYGDDLALSALIDASSIDEVVTEIWEQKASSLSALVNVSESGSSRSLGDLHKNALTMWKFYKDKVAAGDVTVARPARSRVAVRENGI